VICEQSKTGLAMAAWQFLVTDNSILLEHPAVHVQGTCDQVVESKAL